MIHETGVNHSLYTGYEWVGWLDLDLRSASDWSVASLQIQVERDTVALWQGDRPGEQKSLASMDREKFREWLIHPRDRMPFVADEVVWSLQQGIAQVSIDRGGDYLVKPDSLANLAAVV